MESRVLIHGVITDEDVMYEAEVFIQSDGYRYVANVITHRFSDFARCRVTDELSKTIHDDIQRHLKMYDNVYN